MWEILSDEDVEAIRWGSLDANTFEGPEEYAERREMQRHLRSAVAELTEGQRHAVRAYFGLDGRGGRTCAQIAMEMQPTISSARVNQHVRRAMQKLKYSKHHLHMFVDPPGAKRERKAEVWVHIEDVRKQREAEWRNNEKWRLHYEREEREKARRAAPPPPPPPKPTKPQWQVDLSAFLAKRREAKLEREALAARATAMGRSAEAQWQLEREAGIHSMTHWRYGDV